MLLTSKWGRIQPEIQIWWLWCFMQSYWAVRSGVWGTKRCAQDGFWPDIALWTSWPTVNCNDLYNSYNKWKVLELFIYSIQSALNSTKFLYNFLLKLISSHSLCLVFLVATEEISQGILPSTLALQLTNSQLFHRNGDQIYLSYPKCKKYQFCIWKKD